MTVMNHYEEYVKEAIGAGADFIVSGAGLPVNLAKYAAGTRAAILPIVSSARALKLIVKQWQRADRLPDAVVVEGAACRWTPWIPLWTPCGRHF